jgi:hypothetical protein
MVDYHVRRDHTREFEVRSGYPLFVIEANGLVYEYQTVHDHFFVLLRGTGAEPPNGGVIVNQTRGTALYYCDERKGSVEAAERIDAAEQTDTREPD